MDEGEVVDFPFQIVLGEVVLVVEDCFEGLVEDGFGRVGLEDVLAEVGVEFFLGEAGSCDEERGGEVVSVVVADDFHNSSSNLQFYSP